MYFRVVRLLALWGALAGIVSVYFFVFWHWFEFWKKRRALWYAMVASVFAGFGLALYLARRYTFGWRFHFPTGVHVAGWIVIAVITIFGTIADRQIGLRVRSFRPFFDDTVKIELKTTGAYGVVRHPIYAAGIGFVFGIFLVSGYPVVLGAGSVFALGALWFTRQEEEHLMALLDDATEYERYRERVPALLPRLRRGSSLGSGERGKR